MITQQDIFNEKVMALSWKQPYADLMMHGKIETRLWPTRYRGLVLICSSKKAYSEDEMEAIAGEYFVYKLVRFLKAGISHQLLDGNAIAIGRLVDCRPMQPEDEALTLVKYRKPWVETICRGKKRQYKLVERQLWCHIYEDVTPIVQFPWKGTQGWKVLDDFHKNLIKPIPEVELMRAAREFQKQPKQFTKPNYQ